MPSPSRRRMALARGVFPSHRPRCVGLERAGH
jgi:hypothetical protein